MRAACSPCLASFSKEEQDRENIAHLWIHRQFDFRTMLPDFNNRLLLGYLLNSPWIGSAK